jgi:thiamine biosynthesis lipoprotein
MSRRARPLLGTLVEIDIDDGGNAAANAAFNATSIAAFEAAFARIALIHRLMSFHEAHSDVSRINLAPINTPIRVDTHTYRVLQAALDLQEKSAGLFDIRTAARLVEWGHLPHCVADAHDAHDAPDAADTAAAIPAYQPLCQAHQLLPDNIVVKTRNDWLDLGGIAKGYAVDQAVAVLRAAGVTQGSVNAGGDMRVFGARAIPVHVRNARQPSRTGQQIQLKNQALATSAIYFSQKTDASGNIISSALVNGRDGTPVCARRSVSVRADACIWADALTKVVAASGDPAHPCLAHYGAQAMP